MELDPIIIARLLLSAILGGLVGLEREIHGRPAGFRTHLLVSLGSCLFTVVSIYFHELWGGSSGSGIVAADPGRIAAQVVTGIGFLGAGAIIREKASIRGLTTAACLWVVSAVGIACGVGMYLTALFVAVIAISSLLLLKKVEDSLRRDTYSAVKIWSVDLEGQMARIEELLAGFGMRMLNASVEHDLEKQEIFLEFEIKLSSRVLAYRVIDSITAIEGMKKVRLE
jgi:putative Mg2+ transporter-C (MgtC) family protein